MAPPAKDPWEELRRIYDPSAFPAFALGHAARAPSSDVEDQTAQDRATRLDLAEERAAIMEYDGGLSRADAEERVAQLHGPLLPCSGSGR